MSEPAVDHGVRTVGGLLDRAVAEHGDRIALVYEEERITYADLGVRVERLAHALRNAGIAAGDRVAVRLSNCIEWIDTLFAVAKIGAVLVPLNHSLADSEVRDLLARSRSKLVFSGSDERLREVTAHLAANPLNRLEHVVAVGPDPVAGVSSYEDFLAAHPAADEPLPADASPDDMLFLIYTSGTTGRPKGVMHSHSMLPNMRDVAERLSFSASDAVVLYLPLCHVYALFVGVLAMLGVGAKIVLMSRFHAAASLDLIERERATVMFGVQTMYYDQIVQLPLAQRDLSSVRLCLASGPPQHVRNVRRHFGVAINLYGMTECCAITSLASPADPEDLSADTSGLPLPGFETRVRDSWGQTHRSGRGECEVRGAAITTGYFEDPEATAAAFSEDGWFKTGDEVELTEEGRLRFLGRVRDSYKVGGEIVDPVEVETVIAAHQSVGMAAAVGLADARLGEIGVVFVQPAPGHTVDIAGVLEHARAQLARFKVPRQIHVVDEFPKTSTGKIQKHLLRVRAQELSQSDD